MTIRITGLLMACMLFLLTGCQSKTDALFAEFKDLNKYNVAKVKTCFYMFASRNNQATPENKEELVAFLTGGTVDKNLKRAGIDPSNVEAIFSSERDGQPLKIRWGVELDPDMPTPIAFETEGVDGVRLVAADVVLEVKSNEEYDELWEGNYTPAFVALKQSADVK